MPHINAETANGETQTVDAQPNQKLVLALEDAGIDILHRCGGKAKCTTCRVEILAGDPGEMLELEKNRLAAEVDLAENVRLSCQVRVIDDIKVKILRQVSTSGLDAGPRPADD